MKKEYFNQEAYNYVASKINKTKINSVFKPIIIDIILRRRHEYHLDDNFFHRDVESFINNVKNIYFANLPEKKGGAFDPKEKCIRINQNEFNEIMSDEKYEKLLSVISHESGHAMNFDETGKDRTFKIDPTNPADSTIPIEGILEIFNEKESDRLICNRKLEDAFKYYNETAGYNATTNYVNAIAAAFGIKEKELLSAAIKGEKELYEALNANIKDENFSKEKFQEISFNIRIVHKELYKDNDDEINKENLGYSLKKIYENSEQVLAYRIGNLEWDNLEELQKKLEDIKLSQNAISNIMPKINVDKEFAMSRKRITYTKIMCMEEIIKSKNENSKELINFVQHSKNADEILEFMNQNGIEINSENLASMPEFELSQQKKDEWAKEFCLDGEEWDNTGIIKYMMANKQKIMNSRENISSKIKRGMSKIPLIRIYMNGIEHAWKVCKNLWETFRKKDSNEKPLLLDEREKRRKETMGCI